MPQHILLLRGINLASTNRISMPELRAALEQAGFGEPRTYLQSGNVVVSSDANGAELARAAERVIKQEFGFDVPVVQRTRAQLAKVVELNPLGETATEPKRYQVSFLSAKPARAVVRRIEEAAAPGERVVVHGREVYAWHPETIARSRLWALLAGQRLGVTATARNWTTVTKLLELAGEEVSTRA